jgi:hypothetical protein
MIALLEFLGMRKLIEVPADTINYRVALPMNIDDVDRYATLVFVAENNPRYGVPHEVEVHFTFDHIERGDVEREQES